MNLYFLDSSAIIKRYIPELGTNWVRNLTASHQNNLILIAPITTIEVISALARRNREGRLTTAHMHFIIQLLRRHQHREYALIPLVEEIELQAEQLLTTYALRGMDAIQLASARFVQQELQQSGLPNIEFISSDVRLLAVAQQVGFVVDNPEPHP